MKVNTQALEEKISSSGLKKGYIVEVLGISWSSFCNKLKGRIPFKVCEVYMLCHILNISDKEKPEIFLP